MTKAEAAAAWAEAKEALDAAHAVMTQARERFEAAAKAETAAWNELQSLAGRTTGSAPASRTWQEQTVPIPPKVVG